MVLGLRQIVHDAAGEHVDQLDVRITHHEPARTSDGHRDLHREPDLGASGRDDQPRPLDGLLHAHCRRAGPGAVVTVDPARDRVAGEVDDVAVVGIELADDCVEHPADVGRELLRTTLGPELPGEGLGQGGEATDVGEQPGSRDTVRERAAGVQRPAAVARDVGVRPVAGEVPRHRFGYPGQWLGRAHAHIVAVPTDRVTAVPRLAPVAAR